MKTYTEFYIKYAKDTKKNAQIGGVETPEFWVWLLDATIKKAEFINEFYEYDEIEEDLLDKLEVRWSDDQDPVLITDDEIPDFFKHYDLDCYRTKYVFETKNADYYLLFDKYDDEESTWFLYRLKNGGDEEICDRDCIQIDEFSGYPEDFIIYKKLINENEFGEEDLEDHELIAIHEISGDPNSDLRDCVFLSIEERFEGKHKTFDRYMGIACYYEHSELKPVLYRRDISFYENSASYNAYEVEELDEFITYFELD